MLVLRLGLGTLATPATGNLLCTRRAHPGESYEARARWAHRDSSRQLLVAVLPGYGHRKCFSSVPCPGINTGTRLNMALPDSNATALDILVIPDNRRHGPPPPAICS
eukprot:969087-Rhodomonas_salina.3